MHIPTHSPLYQKAFEQYLRKGISMEVSIKALLLKFTETEVNHSTPLYRWRTASDEKVRASHAANEGRIFAWGNPPDKGHPGEEMNCRCYAEPVEVDTTPLEVLALLSGAGIVRTIGVRVGGAILRRIGRGREEPPAQKPTRSIEDRPKNIPKDWVKSTSNNGKGVRYRDPNNKHNEVRLQRGEPNSSQSGQRQDYVTWKRNGQWLDKNGKRVPRQSLESHIPIDEFKFRPELFK